MKSKFPPFIVGRQLCWKDHLDFCCHTGWLYVWMYVAGIDFTAGSPVPTGEFPGGPASFVMKRSGGPVDFWDIYKV